MGSTADLGMFSPALFVGVGVSSGCCACFAYSRQPPIRATLSLAAFQLPGGSSVYGLKPSNADGLAPNFAAGVAGAGNDACDAAAGAVGPGCAWDALANVTPRAAALNLQCFLNVNKTMMKIPETIANNHKRRSNRGVLTSACAGGQSNGNVQAQFGPGF